MGRAKSICICRNEQVRKGRHDWWWKRSAATVWRTDRQEGEQEVMRRTRTIKPKNMSSLCFCHLSKFFELESVSGNKSADSPVCVNENQSCLCVRDSKKRSTHSFISVVPDRLWVKTHPSSLPPQPDSTSSISIHVVPASTSTRNLHSHNWWTVCTGWPSHQSSVYLALCFVPSNLVDVLFFFEHPSKRIILFFFSASPSITLIGLSSSFNLPYPPSLRIHLTLWPKVLWWMLIGSHAQKVQYSEE